MKLKRGATLRRPGHRTAECAPSRASATAWWRWGAALFLVTAVGAALLVWWMAIRRVRVQPPPLPANLHQLDQDVLQLIRAQTERIESDPDDPAAYGDLGLMYEANKLWKGARAAYSCAVQLDPADRLWRLHLAMAAQEVGDFPAALSELRTVAERHPEFAPAQQRLGYALLETGEWDAAGAAFERVTQLQPQAAEGYVGLGDVLLRQGNAEQAVGLLEQALKIDPQYAVAHYLIGSALSRLGREQEAAEHLALGVDSQIRYLPDPLTPRLTDYSVNMKARMTAGSRQLVEGHTDQAIRTLEDVLRADPDNVTAINNLAGAYARQKRLDEAHQLLLKALQIDPQKFSTYINLSNWAMLTRDLDQALQYADQAVERAPQKGVPHRTRAVVLTRLGRLDEALVSARQAASLDPRDPRIQMLAADLSLRRRQYTEAEDYFRRVTRLLPDRRDAWLGLSRASRAAGHLEAATEALDRARQLAPDNSASGGPLQ